MHMRTLQRSLSASVLFSGLTIRYEGRMLSGFHYSPFVTVGLCHALWTRLCRGQIIDWFLSHTQLLELLIKSFCSQLMHRGVGIETLICVGDNG